MHRERTIHPPFLEPLMKSTLLRQKHKTNGHLFQTVMECAAALHVYSDKEHLLQFALDAILDLANAHTGSILIWDESSKELVVSVAKGVSMDRVMGTYLKLWEGVSGWVAARGIPVLVEDIRHDDRFRGTKRFGHYQSWSFISLPLLAGNKLVGVINITEREGLGSFTEEDFERAKAVAKHIAIAYENLKIEKHLRKENEELSKDLAQLKEALDDQKPIVSIGKLASNLAHEINNPLDSIRRFVNLALDQVMEDSLAREYLLKAKNGIRRAIQVVRGLLAFSRENSSLTTKMVDLHTVIEKTLANFFQNPTFNKISFEKRFCSEEFLIPDCGLQGVFRNLFENAYHAMNGTGTITIETKRKNGRRSVFCTLSCRSINP